MALAGINRVKVVPPLDPVAAPFAAILLFLDAELRNLVSERLISQRIYPAILWGLKDFAWAKIPEADQDFSRRMLALSCDMRYGPHEIMWVANAVREICT